MPMTNVQEYEHHEHHEHQEHLEQHQEEENNIDQYKFTDHNPEFVQFKKDVTEWLQMDDDLKTLRAATAERNKRKKTLAPDILSFMKENGIENLQTKEGGKLKYRASMVKKPLNQKEIKSKLCNFFNNIKRGEQVANYLLDNREKVERISLSRTRERKKKITTNITF
jgi:hypothetical protein